MLSASVAQDQHRDIGGRLFACRDLWHRHVHGGPSAMLNPYIEAWELRELVLAKEVRPREVAEFFLERIERLNPKLGAFMTVTASPIRSRTSRGPRASGRRSGRRTMRISCRTPIMSMRRIYATRAASCLARRRHRNSADVLLPKAGYVLPRAIPGTSSTLPAGRAAARPVRQPRDSDRWRKAATAADRFASRRVVRNRGAEAFARPRLLCAGFWRSVGRIRDQRPHRAIGARRRDVP